jgi:transglutaminase-like putative cysteine protease
MKVFGRVFSALFIIFVLFFEFSSQTLAISQFSTDYNITYTVLPDGLTQVTYEIDQTNNLSSVYATNFSLSLSEDDVQNVRVVDTAGELYPNITKTSNITLISFDFKGKVAGRGKINKFSVSYQTKNVASKVGSVWEINIPRLVTDEAANAVTITLIVPDNIGEPAYISPSPSQAQGNVYTFNSASLANRPISAVFGKEQFFEFTLYYNLENPGSTKTDIEIALPPDTAYQKVYYQTLEPNPKNIRTDENGNWIATLELEAKQNLKFKALGVVNITMLPKKIALEDKDYFLKETPLWPINSSIVKSELQNLKDTKSIYDYIVGSLTYDYSRLNKDQIRPGALFALENKDQVICTEFTDLFITFSRSLGIPAREIQGYAYSTNEKLRPTSLDRDVLHAWPEYYDSSRQTWVQVDPTWGNTTQGIDYFNKLDLNHFTFAIHGQDITDPLPAGAYKTADSNSKDIYIKPVDEVDFPKESVDFEIISLTPGQAVILAKNQSSAGSNGNLQIENSGEKQVFFLNLAPDEQKELRIELKSNSSKLLLKYNDKEYQFNLNSWDIVKTNTLPIIFIVLGIITIITGYLYFSRQKRKPPLHW